MSIVETPGTLSGRPRIEGTRIGVLHILASLEVGHTPEYIASEQQYPSLSIEQVTEAVDWLYDRPERVVELRLDDLVATERGLRQSEKPPMAIWRQGTTFISEERYGSPVSDGEIIQGLLLEPDGRFARVYYDPIHEGYAVYDIDLDHESATPVLDDQHVTLGDAIDSAAEYATNEDILIADQVMTRRSVCLDELPGR